MKRLVRRIILGFAVLLAIVVIGSPHLRLERFREPIRRALEQALDRHVEINGPVHLRIMPSPGVSLSSVVIHDDPAFSREPIAYVVELGVGISPWRLIAGTIQFDNLRLIRPSVNLVKALDGRWNYPSLIERAFRTSGSSGSVLPRIEVRSGRLNFRFTDVKSVFYLSDADVDIFPEAAPQPTVRFRFAGAPSRTDRAAQGFGNLSGNGRYIYREAEENLLRGVVRLERSAIPDILTLLQGHGAGLGGFVASRAEFEGPVSALGFRGELQLADVDRRFLQPSGSGEWALNFHGRLDLVNQVLQLDTAAGTQKLPISVRLRASDYLQRPRWALFVAADQLPIETLPALGREMGLPVPAALRAGGTLSGGLGFGGDTGIRGGFEMRDFTLLGTGDTVLQFEPVAVTVNPDRWHAEPVRVVTGSNASVSLGLTRHHASNLLELRLQTDRLELERSRAIWTEYMKTTLPPSLAGWRGGHWSGDLVFWASPEGSEWSGDVVIQAATRAVSGLAHPVVVDRAEGDANGEAVRLTGSAGGQRFTATIHAANGAESVVISLDLNGVSGPALEKLLEPSLSWQRGFLERALRIGSGQMPGWLRQRKVEVEFRVGTLRASPVTLTDLKGRLHWDGPSIILYLDDARANGGEIAGRLVAGLERGRPHYVVDATVAGYPWAGGTLGAVGTLASAGTGLTLLTGASAEGLFTLQYPGSGPHGSFETAAGYFELGEVHGVPLLQLTGLELTAGESSYSGSGRLSRLDQIELELFGDGRVFSATGSLQPFHINLGELAPITVE